VTAGNSSQITDGATWLVLATDEALEAPQARTCGPHRRTRSGRDWIPAQMGLGPVHAATRS